MSNDKNNISDEVMQKIKSGNIHMKPRTYFTFLSLSIAITVALAGLATSYLLSIIFFWFKIEIANTMAYGARRNLSEAIATFPWWILIFIIILLVFITWLIRKHGNMYRHKTSKIILVTLVFSLLLGFVLYALGIGNIHGFKHGNLSVEHRGHGWQHHK